jgi:hypothetical protein
MKDKTTIFKPIIKPKKVIIKPVLNRPKYKLPKEAQEKLDKGSWFIKKYKRTLDLGFSISMVVVGKRTGMSKTYCSLRMGELLDPKGFTAKEVDEGKYSFYSQHFIPVIRDIEFYRWAFFDEPGRKGSGGARHEWQSDANKAVSSTCQISRFKCPVSPFILPHRNLLFGQVFGLCQIMLVFNERGKANVYSINVSEFTGDIFTPYEGKIIFDYPDRDLRQAVEQKKAEMFQLDTTKWANEIIREERQSHKPDEIFQRLLETGDINNYLLIKYDKVRADPKKLMLKEHIGKSKAYELKNIIDAYIIDKDIKMP